MDDSFWNQKLLNTLLQKRSYLACLLRKRFRDWICFLISCIGSLDFCCACIELLTSQWGVTFYVSGISCKGNMEHKVRHFVLKILVRKSFANGSAIQWEYIVDKSEQGDFWRITSFTVFIWVASDYQIIAFLATHFSCVNASLRYGINRQDFLRFSFLWWRNAYVSNSYL